MTDELPSSKRRCVMAKLKPYRNPDLCPERSNHRVGPINHVDWVEWSDEMAKTHEQAMCPGCDLWVIWIPLEDVANPQATTDQVNNEGE